MNETSVCRTAWCRAVLSMLNANYDAVREGHGTMGIDRDSAAAWWMDQVTFEFLHHDFKKKVFERGINKRGRCGTCVRSSGFFALAAIVWPRISRRRTEPPHQTNLAQLEARDTVD